MFLAEESYLLLIIISLIIFSVDSVSTKNDWGKIVRVSIKQSSHQFIALAFRNLGQTIKVDTFCSPYLNSTSRAGHQENDSPLELPLMFGSWKQQVRAQNPRKFLLSPKYCVPPCSLNITFHLKVLSLELPWAGWLMMMDNVGLSPTWVFFDMNK